MDFVNAGLQRPLVTNSIVKNLIIGMEPTTLLQSKFKGIAKRTLALSWTIKRFGETVAGDVIRGADGNLNQFPKMTYKSVVPPYYYEKLNVTQIDGYDRVFSESDSGQISVGLFNDFRANLMEQTKQVISKIKRSIELQAREVYTKGTVTPLNAPVIDFKRKAGSFVDPGAGNYWANDGVDPYKQLAAGGDFIRKNGKYMGGTFNVIMGEQAFADFLTNSVVSQRNDLKMWKLDTIVSPDMKIEGQTYHGTISCGPYTMHIWQYPQYYEDASNGNALTPYINPKKVYVLPQNPDFQTIYGATPQIVTPGAATASLISGKYIMSEYIDMRSRSHEFHIESRGLPVPIAIDQLYTLFAVAGA